MKTNLFIGFSEISITPEQRVNLAGQFAPRVSESVESPVTATAMAVETEQEQFVICSCDLVNITHDLQTEIRRRLRTSTPGLDPAKVILCATHTHTSLVYKNENRPISLDVLQRYIPKKQRAQTRKKAPPNVMSPEKAFDFLAEKIADAVSAAWKAKRPAAVACAFGRAVVGHCRRVVFSDGSSAMWGDTNQAVFDRLEGGSDSGIELLYVFDGQKQPIGVLANIACPAQCVQHRRFVSSDYWGAVKTNLRKRLGSNLHVLGLCAAAGDQCPVDMIRWVEPESPTDDPNIERRNPVRRRADPSMFDLAGKEKAGLRIANEIFDVLQEAKTGITSNMPLMHSILNVSLPVRRVTLSEYAQACRELERFSKEHSATKTFHDNARMHVHAGVVARFEYQRNHNLQPIELHAIRFGDIAVATNPFELFLDYGNKIRARSPAAQTFLVQLACGSHGYLPTEQAERGGHYSAYVSSGITGHEGGDLLVRHTIEAINAFWQ